jgi:TonB family protein
VSSLGKSFIYPIVVGAIILFDQFLFCAGSNVSQYGEGVYVDIHIEEPILSEGVAYDTPPKIIKLVKPRCPRIARRARIEGKVKLAIQIDENGDVINARVLKGLGAGCDLSAVEAAYQCKFLPASKKGTSIKAWVEYTVIYKL